MGRSHAPPLFWLIDVIKFIQMDYNEEIKKRGLKKNWIAKKLGISQALFSFYTTGSRPMPEHIERKLKEMLK